MSKELSPLEALERIKKARYFVDFELDAKVSEDYKKELDIIETALKENEYLKTELLGQSQELNVKNKALEIIKKKKVDIKDLYKVLSFYLIHLDCELKEYIYYNSLKTAEERLTEKEYNLLKEVLL